AIAFALYELLLNMVFSNESHNRFLNRFWHRDRFNNVDSGFGHRLTLGRVRCDQRQLIGWIAFDGAEDDPQLGRFRVQVVAIVCSFRPVQFDVGSADIECCALSVIREFGPGRRVGDTNQYPDRMPMKVDPRTCALTALDQTPDGDSHQRYRTQLTASTRRTGRPVSRFCGFMRMVLSGGVARLRYTGSPLTLAPMTEGSWKFSRNNPTTRASVASSTSSPRQSLSPIA